MELKIITTANGVRKMKIGLKNKIDKLRLICVKNLALSKELLLFHFQNMCNCLILLTLLQYFKIMVILKNGMTLKMMKTNLCFKKFKVFVIKLIVYIFTQKAINQM